MTTSDGDVVIAGGGLSGLATAYYLKKFAPDLRVTVLEKRAHYIQDRHWAFWLDEREDFDFSALICQRYRQWSVARTANDGFTCRAGHLRYCLIRSEDWYAEMAKTLGDCIVTGVECHAVTRDSVVTDQGVYGAPVVINALPPEKNQTGLYQQFHGWIIETDRPCFDVDCATLMDFSVAQPRNACAFVYLLPLAANRALVEPTVLTADLLPSAWFEDRIKNYLADKNITVWQQLEAEAGILPLTLPHRYDDRQQGFPIGMRAGWMRASTGYSFLNSLRLAKILACQISSCHRLPAQIPRPYSTGALWMDAVFLKVIEQSPALLPEIFVNWFRKIPADSLPLFLQDQAGLQTSAHVIFSTKNKLQFLRQLCRR